MKDASVRENVVQDYRSNVAVSAGAGTGKTTLLVGRIVAAWANDNDTVDPTNTLAITFTRAAALEMRIRLRYAMQAKAEELGNPIVSERAQMVDAAAIETIHAFCQRILEEFCLEAGLPPRFTVMSKAATADAKADWWNGFLRGCLSDEHGTFLLETLMDCGLSFDGMLNLADAVESERISLRQAARQEAEGPLSQRYMQDIREVLEGIRRIAAECKDPADKLYDRVQELIERVEGIVQAGAGSIGRLTLGSGGTEKNWGRKGKEVRDEIKALCLKPSRSLLVELAARMHESLEEFAANRAQRGMITTDDLLTLAHDLILESEGARRTICQRYPHIYLDEVQDTDPIQSRIMVALAEHARQDPEVEDMCIFVVGDVEQSIYGFRGASPDSFSGLISKMGLEQQNLITNFRCHHQILDWVNARFLGEDRHLHAGLDLPTSEVSRVSTTGVEESDASAGERRQSEAAAIAAYLHQAKSEAWQIRDGDETRPASWRDMVVLCRTRTAWPFLIEQFQRLGIPFITEVEARLFELPEFAELVELITAIADPDDSIAMIAAAKSAFIRCSNSDLLKYKLQNHIDHPDQPHAKQLAEWRGLIEGLSLKSSLIRLQAVLEPLVIGTAAEDTVKAWNRYRRVFQLAHSFADRGAASLFEVAQSFHSLRTQRETEHEVVGSQESTDAVRLVTAHGSKGLEYPIVAVCGFFFAGRSNSNIVVDLVGSEIAVEISADLHTGHQLKKEKKDKQRIEERRLLYVACTRARDYLLVSFHGWKDGSKNAESTAFAELKELLKTETEYALPPNQTPFPREVATAAPLPDFTDSELARPDLTPPELPKEESDATADPDEPMDTPPSESGGEDGEIKGNYGAAIGRAVHAALYTCDLSDLAGIHSLARFHAEAEGVGHLGERIAERVVSALESNLVRAAGGQPHYRELYIGSWIEAVETIDSVDSAGDGRVQSQYIDLLYNDGDRYILVDYKTDEVNESGAEFQAQKYKPQIDRYAETLQRDHGIQVAEAYILFVSQNPAISKRLI